MTDDGIFTRIEKQHAAVVIDKKYADLSLPMLHKAECRACPLNHSKGEHTKIQPAGAQQPLIYILGEAPGSEEESDGSHFSGRAGQFLRKSIHKDWLPLLRWNTVIRTRPSTNRAPDPVEIECCRPSIVRDIEASKPKAIFGFGAVPLNWALGFDSIKAWRGRWLPVKIGNHACWFFPFLHPSYIIRASSQQGDDEFSAEWESTFKRDLNQALLLTETLPDAEVQELNEDGLILLTGKSGDLETLRSFLLSLRGKHSTIDLETTCLRPYAKEARILTCSVGTQENAIAFPIDHPGAQWKGHELNEALRLLQQYLLTPDPKGAHNLSFDLEWLVELFGTKIAYASEWHDSRVQSYVLDERPGAQSLDACVLTQFGIHLKTEMDARYLEGTKLQTVLRYNALDVKYTDAVFHKQMQQLQALRLDSVYQLQVKRVPACVLAQVKGLDVDAAEVNRHRALVEAESIAIQNEIQAMPEVEVFRNRYGAFNQGSPKDLTLMFRDVLGVTQEDAGKKFSTDEDALALIKHPMAALVVKLRQLAKLESTYVAPLTPDFAKTVVHPDGKIHTILKHTSTDTTRLSSEGPNIQNFPKRKNKQVRSMIHAPAGHVMVAADYGQIEARVIAMMSKDKALVKAMWEGFDIHQFWALRLADDEGLDRTDKKAVKAYRDRIKNELVFPAFFGAQPYSIGRSLKIHDARMAEIFKDFWEMFESVPGWQNGLRSFYKKNGYVELLTGFRRHAPLTQNMIINTPVQGTAAQLVVDAMERLARKSVLEDKPWLAPVMQIHDDLTFYVPIEKQENAIEEIITEMCTFSFPWINVPIQIELSIGSNWGEMKDIGKFQSNEL